MSAYHATEILVGRGHVVDFDGEIAVLCCALGIDHGGWWFGDFLGREDLVMCMFVWGRVVVMFGCSMLFDLEI